MNVSEEDVADEYKKLDSHKISNKHIEVMHPPIYHGFYCANVEPSTTTYRIGPEQPEREWIVHQDYDDMLIWY